MRGDLGLALDSRQQLVGAVQVPEVDQALDQIDGDRGAAPVAVGGERQRPLEQVAGRRAVLTRACAAARAMQVEGGTASERHIRCAAQLLPVAHGLLEVPADDLLVLGQTAVDVLEPGGEPLGRSARVALGSPS